MARVFQEALPRSLTIWGAVLLAVNGLIGTGIFFLPASVGATSGPWSPVIFLAAGLVLLPIVFVLVWFAKTTRQTGGTIVYVERGLGARAAEPASWLQLVASLAGAAASVRMLMNLLAAQFPSLTGAAAQPVFLLLLLGALVSVLVVGLKRGLSLLAGVTFFKLVPLVVLLIGAMAALAKPTALAPVDFVPGSYHLVDALFLAVFACLGFEAAIVPAGEAKDPERDLGRGMLRTYVAVVLLYSLVQLICFRFNPNLFNSKNPVLDTVKILCGPEWARILTYGVMFSILGYLLTALMVGGRYPYALAKLGWFPGIFTTVHKRFGTPWASLLFYGAAVGLLASSNGFLLLAKITTLAKILMLSLCVSSWISLRIKGQVQRQSVWEPVILLVAASGCTTLILAADRTAWLMLLGLFAICVALSAIRATFNRSTEVGADGIRV